MLQAGEQRALLGRQLVADQLEDRREAHAAAVAATFDNGNSNGSVTGRQSRDTRDTRLSESADFGDANEAAGLNASSVSSSSSTFSVRKHQPVTALTKLIRSPSNASMHVSLAVSSKRVMPASAFVAGEVGTDDILESDVRALLEHAHVRALLDRVRMVRAQIALADIAMREMRMAEARAVGDATASVIAAAAAGAQLGISPRRSASTHSEVDGGGGGGSRDSRERSLSRTGTAAESPSASTAGAGSQPQKEGKVVPRSARHNSIDAGSAIKSRESSPARQKKHASRDQHPTPHDGGGGSSAAAQASASAAAAPFSVAPLDQRAGIRGIGSSNSTHSSRGNSRSTSPHPPSAAAAAAAAVGVITTPRNSPGGGSTAAAGNSSSASAYRTPPLYSPSQPFLQQQQQHQQTGTSPANYFSVPSAVTGFKISANGQIIPASAYASQQASGAQTPNLQEVAAASVRAAFAGVAASSAALGRMGGGVSSPSSTASRSPAGPGPTGLFNANGTFNTNSYTGINGNHNGVGSTIAATPSRPSSAGLFSHGPAAAAADAYLWNRASASGTPINAGLTTSALSRSGFAGRGSPADLGTYASGSASLHGMPPAQNMPVHVQQLRSTPIPLQQQLPTIQSMLAQQLIQQLNLTPQQQAQLLQMQAQSAAMQQSRNAAGSAGSSAAGAGSSNGSSLENALQLSAGIVSNLFNSLPAHQQLQATGSGQSSTLNTPNKQMFSSSMLPSGTGVYGGINAQHSTSSVPGSYTASPSGQGAAMQQLAAVNNARLQQLQAQRGDGASISSGGKAGASGPSSALVTPEPSMIIHAGVTPQASVSYLSQQRGSPSSRGPASPSSSPSAYSNHPQPSILPQAHANLMASVSAPSSIYLAQQQILKQNGATNNAAGSNTAASVASTSQYLSYRLLPGQSQQQPTSVPVQQLSMTASHPSTRSNGISGSGVANLDGTLAPYPSIISVGNHGHSLSPSGGPAMVTAAQQQQQSQGGRFGYGSNVSSPSGSIYNSTANNNHNGVGDGSTSPAQRNRPSASPPRTAPVHSRRGRGSTRDMSGKKDTSEQPQPGTSTGGARRSVTRGGPAASSSPSRNDNGGRGDGQVIGSVKKLTHAEVKAMRMQMLETQVGVLSTKITKQNQELHMLHTLQTTIEKRNARAWTGRKVTGSVLDDDQMHALKKLSKSANASKGGSSSVSNGGMNPGSGASSGGLMVTPSQQLPRGYGGPQMGTGGGGGGYHNGGQSGFGNNHDSQYPDGNNNNYAEDGPMMPSTIHGVDENGNIVLLDPAQQLLNQQQQQYARQSTSDANDGSNAPGEKRMPTLETVIPPSIYVVAAASAARAANLLKEQESRRDRRSSPSGSRAASRSTSRAPPSASGNNRSTSPSALPRPLGGLPSRGNLHTRGSSSPSHGGGTSGGGAVGSNNRSTPGLRSRAGSSGRGYGPIDVQPMYPLQSDDDGGGQQHDGADDGAAVEAGLATDEAEQSPRQQAPVGFSPEPPRMRGTSALATHNAGRAGAPAANNGRLPSRQAGARPTTVPPQASPSRSPSRGAASIRAASPSNNGTAARTPSRGGYPAARAGTANGRSGPASAAKSYSYPAGGSNGSGSGAGPEGRASMSPVRATAVASSPSRAGSSSPVRTTSPALRNRPAPGQANPASPARGRSPVKAGTSSSATTNSSNRVNTASSPTRAGTAAGGAARPGAATTAQKSGGAASSSRPLTRGAAPAAAANSTKKPLPKSPTRQPVTATPNRPANNNSRAASAVSSVKPGVRNVAAGKSNSAASNASSMKQAPTSPGTNNNNKLKQSLPSRPTTAFTVDSSATGSGTVATVTAACSSCGSKVKMPANFCSNCGTRMVAVQSRNGDHGDADDVDNAMGRGTIETGHDEEAANPHSPGAHHIRDGNGTMSQLHSSLPTPASTVTGMLFPTGDEAGVGVGHDQQVSRAGHGLDKRTSNDGARQNGGAGDNADDIADGDDGMESDAEGIEHSNDGGSANDYAGSSASAGSGRGSSNSGGINMMPVVDSPSGANGNGGSLNTDSISGGASQSISRGRVARKADYINRPKHHGRVASPKLETLPGSADAEGAGAASSGSAGDAEGGGGRGRRYPRNGPPRSPPLGRPDSQGNVVYSRSGTAASASEVGGVHHQSNDGGDPFPLPPPSSATADDGDEYADDHDASADDISAAVPGTGAASFGPRSSSAALAAVSEASADAEVDSPHAGEGGTAGTATSSSSSLRSKAAASPSISALATAVSHERPTARSLSPLGKQRVAALTPSAATNSTPRASTPSSVVPVQLTMDGVPKRATATAATEDGKVVVTVSLSAAPVTVRPASNPPSSAPLHAASVTAAVAAAHDIATGDGVQPPIVPTRESTHATRESTTAGFPNTFDRRSAEQAELEAEVELAMTRVVANSNAHGQSSAHSYQQQHDADAYSGIVSPSDAAVPDSFHISAATATSTQQEQHDEHAYSKFSRETAVSE